MSIHLSGLLIRNHYDKSENLLTFISLDFLVFCSKARLLSEYLNGNTQVNTSRFPIPTAR